MLLICYVLSDVLWYAELCRNGPPLWKGPHQTEFHNKQRDDIEKAMKAASGNEALTTAIIGIMGCPP